jgi:FAD/FMN-containing dehydrogenase
MPPLPPPEIAALQAELQRGMRGEVRFDQLSRWLYATDASIYQQQPLGLVLPRDEEDLAFVLRVARDRRLPLLTRGAGTSLAGQATGAAIVIDTSKYINRILDFDPSGRRVRVEPGVIRDQLNRHLASSGLHFAPETATSNRACIGGMIGNNSSGAHAIRMGKTSDHCHELTVHLVTGERLTLERLSPPQWAERARRPGREGAIYRGVKEIVDRLRPEIERRYPRLIWPIWCWAARGRSAW